MRRLTMVALVLGACGGTQVQTAPAEEAPPPVSEPIARTPPPALPVEPEPPPEPPRPPLTRATARPSIALGAQHSCLLSVQGEVYCWGSNRFGQLGTGDAMGYREFANRPRRIGGEFIQLASGAWNTCALRADGHAVCWGHGGYGQLGPGTEDHATPVELDVDDIVGLAIGTGHLCALRSDATVWCRGDNGMGQLGDGSRNASDEFRQALLRGEEIAAGRAHTCVRDGDTLSCIGENLDGQVGTGTRTSAELQPVVLPLAGVEGFALGGGHSCLRAEGSAWCWGRNDSFQLGDVAVEGEGPTRFTPGPVDVGPADALALGARFSCVLREGRVFCTGLGHRGQIGDGGRRLRRTWAGVSRLRRVTAIATGAQHACAIMGGSVRCWGSGRRGQLGDGHAEDRSRPVRVVGLRRDHLENSSE